MTKSQVLYFITSMLFLVVTLISITPYYNMLNIILNGSAWLGFGYLYINSCSKEIK